MNIGWAQFAGTVAPSRALLSSDDWTRVNDPFIRQKGRTSLVASPETSPRDALARSTPEPPPMETIHIVQPFTRVRSHLMPALAQQFSSADAAAWRAGIIANDYAGIVAYSMDVDEDGGEYSDPIVLFKAGEVPELD